MKVDLKKLKSDTDKLLKIAKKRNIQGAINWADLWCVRAEYWEADDDDAGLRVWVEEAAPDNQELHMFLYDELQKMGYIGVEIQTEW